MSIVDPNARNATRQSGTFTTNTSNQKIAERSSEIKAKKILIVDSENSLSRSVTNSELVIEYQKNRESGEGYISSYVHKMDETPSS